MLSRYAARGRSKIPPTSRNRLSSLVSVASTPLQNEDSNPHNHRCYSSSAVVHGPLGDLLEALNSSTIAPVSPTPIALSWNPFGKPAVESAESGNSGGSSEKSFVDATSSSSTSEVKDITEEALEIIENVNQSGAETVSSSLSAADLTSWPHHQLMQFLDFVHVETGIPYWQVIAITTFSFRFAMLPVAISALRNGSRMAHCQPELKVIQERMAADPRAKIGGPKGDPTVQQNYSKQMNAVFQKWGCHPIKSLGPPLLQMPLFMSFFFGCKTMGDYYPGMATGGDYFFHDLTAPDGSGCYVLPLICSFTFLCMIEVGADGMQTAGGDGDAKKKMFKNVFRGLGVLMVPMTMHFPQSVFMYWVTNNFFSLGQTIMLKPEPVKNYFGILKPPASVPGQNNDPMSQVRCCSLSVFY